MNKFVIPVLIKDEIEALSRKELQNNDYICETAGFEPLEVKFKRFENAGLLNMINKQALTSADYREMYLNPDFDVSIDDDPEDIIDKMHDLQKHILSVQQKAAERNKKVGSSEGTADSPSVSAAEKTDDLKKSEE